MLDLPGLKVWLHQEWPPRTKLLLVLASFDAPAHVAEMRSRAEDAGFKLPKKWNVSAILSKSGGMAIRVPSGWELAGAGASYLSTLGVSAGSAAAVQVATDLRKHLNNISSPTTRAFVDEAIRCHEAKLHRSAIVMSWVAAVDVLYREVVANHLAAFNVEAVKVNPKWKAAVNEDGLALMKEADFLDRLAAINIVGKNVKDELAKALKLRNGCGHPNSPQIGPNMVAGHLESLLLNVFEKFSV